MQTSHFDLGSAATLGDLTQKWNQIIEDPKTDPNDPTLATKFLKDQVEPAMQQLGKGVSNEGAQRYAQSRIDEIRNHFVTKTGADMSTLAGVAVSTNLDKVGNIYAGTAFNDPSTTKQGLKSYQDSIDAQIATSGMNAEGIARLREHAEQVKGQIATAGLTGRISKNPDADYSQFAADPAIAPYLKGTDPKMVQQYQQGQQRIQKSQETQERQEKDRQATDAANGIATKAYTDFTRVDPKTGKIIVTDPVGYANATRELASHPGAKQGQLDTMVKFGEGLSASDGKEVTDPLVKRGLQDGILQGAVNVEDIARAHTEGKLSGQDYKDTIGMFNDLKKDPSSGPEIKPALDAVKSELTGTIPGLPGKDVVGEKNYSDFVSKFLPAYGRLGPEDRLKALDFKNPNSLVNQIKQQFARSPQQMMKDRILDYGGAAAAGVTVPTPAPEVITMKGLKVPSTLDTLRKAGTLESNGTIFRDKATGKTYDRNGTPQ